MDDLEDLSGRTGVPEPAHHGRSEPVDPASVGERPARKPAKSPSEPAKKRSFVRELPLLLAIALLLALVIKGLFIQSFFIPSGSMENTLEPGDRVLVNKAVYHVRDIKRGEVVVFNGENSFNGDAAVAADPQSGPLARAFASVGGWFGATAPGEKDYIKRVIGLPGDRVSCCDEQGRLTVNGVPLDESAYLYPGDQPSLDPFDIVVPADRLWVMGDHRSVSQDSRAHLGQPGGGTVPIDQVVGRAFVIVWPLNHAGTLRIPDTFSQPGLSGG